MPRTLRRGEILLHASTNEASACARRYACVACAAPGAAPIFRKSWPSQRPTTPLVVIRCEAKRTEEGREGTRRQPARRRGDRSAVHSGRLSIRPRALISAHALLARCRYPVKTASATVVVIIAPMVARGG